MLVQQSKSAEVAHLRFGTPSSSNCATPKPESHYWGSAATGPDAWCWAGSDDLAVRVHRRGYQATGSRALFPAHRGATVRPAILDRTLIRRLPIFHGGMTPRLVQSSAGDFGTRRSAATSAAVMTSTAATRCSTRRPTIPRLHRASVAGGARLVLEDGDASRASNVWRWPVLDHQPLSALTGMRRSRRGPRAACAMRPLAQAPDRGRGEVDGPYKPSRGRDSWLPSTGLP